MNSFIDPDISLESKTHRYILSTVPDLEFESVTTLVARFFEPFDKVRIASKLVANNEKYFGLTVEELIAQWDSKRDHGTLVHGQIEEHLRHETPATDQKALAALKWLRKYRMKSELKLFPEVIVYSKEHKIAGTVDLLVQDLTTGKYELLDWKTSKSIDTTSFGGKVGINSITEDLLDCNFNRYSLQLSFYRYLLEEKYGIDISDQYIVHIKYDDCHGYIAPYLQSHVTSILKHTH